MGLLGNIFKKEAQDAGSRNATLIAKRCAQCGRKIEGSGIRKYEKDFDSPKCLAKYDEMNRSKSKQACEFC